MMMLTTSRTTVRIPFVENKTSTVGDAWFDEPVAVAAELLLVGVVSPSVSDTFPNSVLSNAHIFLIPSTTLGRFGVSRMSDWFVWMKL